jgi:hypothetical protein
MFNATYHRASHAHTVTRFAVVNLWPDASSVCGKAALRPGQPLLEKAAKVRQNIRHRDAGSLLPRLAMGLLTVNQKRQLREVRVLCPAHDLLLALDKTHRPRLDTNLHSIRWNDAGDWVEITAAFLG